MKIGLKVDFSLFHLGNGKESSSLQKKTVVIPFNVEKNGICLQGDIEYGY